MAATSAGSAGTSSGLRPVGQMHGPLAGDAAPDHLGDQRQQRRGQPAGHLEHRVQCVDGVGVLLPEPRTGPSHIPIRQRLGELAELVARPGDVADVQRVGEVVAQLRQLRQDVAVEDVPRIGAPGTLLGAYSARKRVRVPERQQHLPDAVADALFGDDQVAAAQDRRRHQEPPHGVGAVAVEHLGDVGIVAQRLAHLLTVVAQHDAVRHTGRERRPVEQRGGQHVQRVEPAPGLADVLDDEVAREVACRTTRRSRTGSAPVRTASSRSRTRRRTRPRCAASSTGRSGRRGWAGSARRCRAGADCPAARRSRARARRGCRRRRCADTPGSSDFHTGIGVPQ